MTRAAGSHAHHAGIGPGRAARTGGMPGGGVSVAKIVFLFRQFGVKNSPYAELLTFFRELVHILMVYLYFSQHFVAIHNQGASE
jgi:hypothetical protein